jgi:hypothetical protein
VASDPYFHVSPERAPTNVRRFERVFMTPNFDPHSTRTFGHVLPDLV